MEFFPIGLLQALESSVSATIDCMGATRIKMFRMDLMGKSQHLIYREGSKAQHLRLPMVNIRNFSESGVGYVTTDTATGAHDC